MKGAATESRDIREIARDQMSAAEAPSGGEGSVAAAPASAPDLSAVLPADLNPAGTGAVEPAETEPATAPAPAPASAERDALLSEIGELRVKARNADAMTDLLAKNPDLREQFIARVNGTGDTTGIPANYEELSPVDQAKALSSYFVEQARQQLAPVFRAELDSVRKEIIQGKQEQELFSLRPEAAAEIQKPEVLEKCEAYLSRFEDLPIEKQPSLLEAYDFVQSQTWRASALRAEASNQTAQRQAAAKLQKPGANPGAELGVDVRKAPSDRDAFRMAAAEADRLTRQT